MEIMLILIKKLIYYPIFKNPLLIICEILKHSGILVLRSEYKKADAAYMCTKLWEKRTEKD